mgnify:CR=1 FL=1
MRGRDKKTKAYDKLRKDDVFERNVDEAARERFRRPTYQAGSMVQAQGRQLEHRTLIEYMAERCDIKADLEGETDGKKHSG